MKASLVSSLIGLSFVLMACQPKDVDYRTQTARVNSNNSGGPEKSVDMTPKETQLMMVVSLERMAEALHLAKAFLSPDYAAANGLVKLQTDRSLSADEINETYLETIKVDKKNKSGEAGNAQVIAKKTNHINELSYKVDEFSMDPSGKLRKLILIKNNFKLVSQMGVMDLGGNKKTDFKAVNISDRIVIRATSDEGIYLVKISRSDSTASKADKNTTMYLDVAFKIQWSGEINHLDGDLQITDLQMKFDRIGSKAGRFQVRSTPENLTVKIGADCASMNGVIDLGLAAGTDSKMTNPEKITLVDSTASFELSKLFSKAQACAVRPVVDLTRLL